jgi:hypothetical protein
MPRRKRRASSTALLQSRGKASSRSGCLLGSSESRRRQSQEQKCEGAEAHCCVGLNAAGRALINRSQAAAFTRRSSSRDSVVANG